MFFKDKELTENVEQLKYMIDEINEKIKVFSNANATTRIDHNMLMEEHEELKKIIKQNENFLCEINSKLIERKKELSDYKQETSEKIFKFIQQKKETIQNEAKTAERNLHDFFDGRVTRIEDVIKALIEVFAPTPKQQTITEEIKSKKNYNPKSLENLELSPNIAKRKYVKSGKFKMKSQDNTKSNTGSWEEFFIYHRDLFLRAHEAAEILDVNEYTFRSWDHLLPIYTHPNHGYRLYAKEDIEFLKREKDADRLPAALDALKNKKSTLNPEAK